MDFEERKHKVIKAFLETMSTLPLEVLVDRLQDGVKNKFHAVSLLMLTTAIAYKLNAMIDKEISVEELTKKALDEQKRHGTTPRDN